MYFSQFFCGVNKKAYPFESRTRRHSPRRKNSIIKFLCSYFMIMSLPFSVFPYLWCTLVYAHLIQFFNKSPDEKITDHPSADKGSLSGIPQNLDVSLHTLLLQLLY
jgi:hypothetical protein